MLQGFGSVVSHLTEVVSRIPEGAERHVSGIAFEKRQAGTLRNPPGREIESRQNISEDIIFDEAVDFLFRILPPECPAAQGRHNQLEKNHAGGKVGVFYLE